MAEFPKIPCPPGQLASYIADHPETHITEILAPFRQYEAHLRGVFAQDRQNPLLADPHINLLPLFTSDTSRITTRARNLEVETEEEKSRYVMELPDEKRRANGAPATVANIEEFRHNFNLFSESSLTEMDWSNVVAAGSSVVNCLLPVPDEFNVNKRKLREYYHEKFCPASDVDLFLYGLTHEQAIEKMKQIEQAVRDSVLHEVTVVRTKYAVTIASQYPVRHIQIVLRVYKSIGEILTGFDIDAAGGAYDGKQVYVTPRALGSFITQINHIDLSRRSPSYENRLSKYSHRNFEIYWPELDRSRIDPTIYERSFQRTLGLARLLVLERLPTTSVREKYQNQRRQERGRPTLYRNHFRQFGDIKSNYEDEVADWLSEEEVSSYHTFTIPYGQKFNAKKIEKLCYSRDLLLNAEWNQPKDRKVYLHRHPAFFGRVQDVIEDCCGSCPAASTKDEIETAEKEAEIYISGSISFLIDDPGRQQIGSFNPLTEEDWTDMAYVGNTARLCQSIVDNDTDDILNWLSQEGADINKRDYTGRTPLHLAVTSSTADTVKCLVDHGARLTARLADGRTALHLASSRGDVDIVKILMEKSIENEAQFEDSKDTVARDDDEHSVPGGDEDSDLEMVDSKTDIDVMSVTTASFIKVPRADSGEDIVSDEVHDEPDYYNIDVLAWDMPCSPLHLAIVGGHEGVVSLLCDYGADAILPVKFLQENDNKAILTLVLALKLPKSKAISMVKLLLKLGAISSQADTNSWTAFHRYVDNNEMEAIDVLLDNDKTAVKAAINHLAFNGYSWNPSAISPLQTAIESENSLLIMKLLTAGASPHIDFEAWLKAAKLGSMYRDLSNFEANKRHFASSIEQPIITAIRHANADLVAQLLDRGVNPDTLTSTGNKIVQNDNFQTWERAESALDLAQRTLRKLRAYKPKDSETEMTCEVALADCKGFLEVQPEDSYKKWLVHRDLIGRKERWETRKHILEEKYQQTAAGKVLKAEAIKTAIGELEKIELMLVSKNAKGFKELYPKYQYSGREDSDNFDRYDNVYGLPQELEKYQFSPQFVGDSDMTPDRLEGYMELMDAAWSGDAERIKQLTLQPWGTNGSLMPLKMDIRDIHGNTPFSIAFLRGHHNAARRVLEVIQAQWSPKETEEVRYKLRDDGDDDDEYEHSDYESSDEESDQDIISEKLNQPFTIDNVGEVSIQVKSHAKPVELLTRIFNISLHFDNRKLNGDTQCRLTRQVLEGDDIVGLKLLIELGQQYSNSNNNDDGNEEGQDSTFTFPADDFVFAVQKGKVDLLRHIIKRTGAGLPLDHLVKKSGIQIKKKPRYYQGLTVYGKKRNDWATAGRNMVVRTEVSNTPPLLHAARGGCIESVEFFMGDAPHRLFTEFAKSKAGREDKRLDVLRKSRGGVDLAISKWLGADNEWVLHCAILSEPSEASSEVVQYLIQTCPSALEKKTSSGATPLLLACSFGRIDSIKQLIKAGADQSTKNHSGENILHVLLAQGAPICGVEAVFKLLDPELRSQLFMQRTNLVSGGNTPLQQWMSRLGQHNNSEAFSRENRMLKMILKFSGGKELNQLNSGGESCLHWAVMTSRINMVQALVDFNPELLVRENAVGRTPAEVAHEKVLSKTFERPNSYYRYNNDDSGVAELIRQHPDHFHSTDTKSSAQQKDDLLRLQESTSLRDEYEPKILARLLVILGVENVGPHDNKVPDDNVRRQVTWDICRTTLAKSENRRRLVSLNEANDVARRLGESHSQSRYFSVESRQDEDAEPADQDDSKKEDYVSSLESSAGRWILPVAGDQPPKCIVCESNHAADAYA